MRGLGAGFLAGSMLVACGGGGDAAPATVPAPGPAPAPASAPVISSLALDTKGAYRDPAVSVTSVNGTFSVVSVGASNIAVVNASFRNSAGQSAGQLTIPVQAGPGSTVQIRVDLLLTQLQLGVYTINLTVQNATGATSNVLTATYSYLANPWETIPRPPPDPSLRFFRDYAAVAETGGKLYVITGMQSSPVSTRFVDVLDLGTRTWTPGMNAPRDRGGAQAVAVNGKIYVIGGFETVTRTPVPEVDVFDPATGNWSQVASLPTPRHLSAIAVLDGKIFVMGGTRSAQAFFNAGVADPMDLVEVFDVATGTWTTGPKLPQALIAPAATTTSGVILLSGGLTATGPTAAYSNLVYRLVPATGTWSTDPGRHLRGRAHHALIAVNDKLYAIGGMSAATPLIPFAHDTTVESASLSAAVGAGLDWTPSAPLNNFAQSFVGFTLGAKGYVWGGGTVFILTPELDVL
jgi:hypothetical protein